MNLLSLIVECLDGRNRHIACERLGIEPVMVEWASGSDVTAFVLSMNLHRRHLTTGQRAMIAAKLATRPHGDQSDTSIEVSSQPDTAALLNVSTTSVQRASRILNEGSPEEIAAVESGEKSVGFPQGRKWSVSTSN